MRVRAMGSPLNSAASGLEPMARTRAPRRVRVSTTVRAITAASRTHRENGAPSSRPPSTVKKEWSIGRSVICLPSASASPTPRYSIEVPRVTMNDGRDR